MATWKEWFAANPDTLVHYTSWMGQAVIAEVRRLLCVSPDYPLPKLVIDLVGGNMDRLRIEFASRNLELAACANRLLWHGIVDEVDDDMDLASDAIYLLLAWSKNCVIYPLLGLWDPRVYYEKDVESKPKGRSGQKTRVKSPLRQVWFAERE
ncbi:hypothetical protein B0T17DRAFT_509847 [Bombardia bombarda]|uniref:Uncharacterized protein n=1 Tax=Bombardia bombarda TaxID=252184 RepID=A0AA39WMW8_9PEZI|nr:hypothetical protein B0T17DRAFT_509847 [Bombardia bombarda]